MSTVIHNRRRQEPQSRKEAEAISLLDKESNQGARKLNFTHTTGIATGSQVLQPLTVFMNTTVDRRGVRGQWFRSLLPESWGLETIDDHFYD